MNKKIILITALILGFIDLKAQVNITKPEGLSGLIFGRSGTRKHPDTKIQGYTILIFRGDNKTAADAQNALFASEFSDYSEVVWEEPNFKVYVGLFKTKLECMELFNQIKDKYQTAIIISQKIPYPPL
ncbi:MAG: hypothetical protein HQ463_07755 [Bacteroidetes bacterium]|nr:hypothetical protein [Bacteroidota bacterium]